MRERIDLLEDPMAKITIVDDSRLARTYTAACLRKGGHEVEEVDPTSLFEVKSLLEATPPDLLLMDYLMPNCPGRRLARLCSEAPELKGMKIVVLTAHRDDEVTAQLKSMGVAEVLHKPFEAQNLLNVMEAALLLPTEE